MELRRILAEDLRPVLIGVLVRGFTLARQCRSSFISIVFLVVAMLTVVANVSGQQIPFFTFIPTPRGITTGGFSYSGL